VPYYEYFNPVACLGYSKLAIGFMKYAPPVYWNYKRKSTKGWSIWNILFDLTGGVFSFASGSIALDNGLNATKLILAIITIVFDLIFVVQHYCIYRGSSTKEGFYLEESK
jgi:cystinosin